MFGVLKMKGLAIDNLFLIVFLLTINTVFASPTININPGIFDFSLYGGESTQKNLTITATGFETAIVVDLYSEIIPKYENDTTGFDVNFSENRFILDNKPKNIIMNISTACNLKPDIFEIKIYAKTEVYQEEKSVYQSRRTKTIYIENKTNQTIYVNKTEYIPFYLNQTKEIIVDRVEDHIIYYENTTKIEDLNQKIESLDKKIQLLEIFSFVCLLLGFFSIAFRLKLY